MHDAMVSLDIILEYINRLLLVILKRSFLAASGFSYVQLTQKSHENGMTKPMSPGRPQAASGRRESASLLGWEHVNEKSWNSNRDFLGEACLQMRAS